MNNGVGPEQILQIGLGFWPSKVLLSAVELGLFTELSGGAMTGAEIEQSLGLHSRGTYDFLDALVAIGMLERHGEISAARQFSGRAVNDDWQCPFRDPRA